MTDRETIPFTSLRAANQARQIAWCEGGDPVPDLAFRGVELAGETGEVCNVIKKLERERHGWRGSRDTKEHLAEELADVVICADLAALTAGIDLDQAVVSKFNATSEKVGLPHRLKAAAMNATALAGHGHGGERYRHKKSGGTYRVIGPAQLQRSGAVGLGDYHPMIVYRSENDGLMWCRPFDEFHDGRFEPLAASPSRQEGGEQTYADPMHDWPEDAKQAYWKIKALHEARMRLIGMVVQQERARKGEGKAWNGSFYADQLAMLSKRDLEPCMECHGTGCEVDPETGPAACDHCGGDGVFVPFTERA